MDRSTPGFPIPHCHPEFAQFMSTESVMLFSNLLLLFSVFPSIRVFFYELALHIRWLNY